MTTLLSSIKQQITIVATGPPFIPSPSPSLLPPPPCIDCQLFQQLYIYKIYILDIWINMGNIYYDTILIYCTDDYGHKY